IRAQHAADLVEGTGLILDRAEHECEDDRVERGVVEGQCLRLAGDDRGVPPARVELLADPSRVRLVGLEEHDLVQTFGVVLDVHARSGSDLEHAAASLLEQLPPFGRELPLCRLLQPVDEPGLDVAGPHPATAAVARRTRTRASSTLYAVPGSGVDASRPASP